jgi:hypothetical protein
MTAFHDELKRRLLRRENLPNEDARRQDLAAIRRWFLKVMSADTVRAYQAWRQSQPEPN